MSRVAKWIGAGILGGGGGINPALYTNLVAYWTLNEVSNGSAPVTRNDSVGTNHLTDTGTTASAAGKLGNAAALVIADQTNLAQAADDTVLSMGDVDMSLCAWINPAAQTGAYQFIVCKYHAAAGRREYYLAMNASNIFEFAVRNTIDNATTTVAETTYGAPAMSTWHFVCCIHDSTANKIYISVNAGARAETATSGGILNGTSKFRIGAADSVGGWFGGLVDAVGVWKGKVLSTTEEAQLYNNGNGVALY